MSTRGYEELVAAAEMLIGTELLEVGAERGEERVREYLTRNAEAHWRARKALQQPCAVEIEFSPVFWKQHHPRTESLRQLGKSLALEMNQLAKQKSLAEAAEVGVTLLELAAAVRRGGLITEMQTGDIIEESGINGLRKIRHGLGTAQRLWLAERLIGLEREREPFESIAARDRQWDETVGKEPVSLESFDELFGNADGTLGKEAALTLRRWMQEFIDLPDEKRMAIHRNNDRRTLAMRRLLAVELALLAYFDHHDTYPARLDALQPDFLADVPIDPFNERPFHFRQVLGSFALYSPGPTGNDHGGAIGTWDAVERGEADLVLDYLDDPVDGILWTATTPT